MGRSPKPLRFLIHPSLAEAHPWHELVAKGHTVVYMRPEDAEFDLMLGPNCWRMDPVVLIQYVDLAIASARAIKFPKKAKEKK